MVVLVPAGAHAHFDPTATHLVHGRDDLREAAWMAERHRRNQDAEPDPLGLAGQPRHDGPRVGRRLAGRTRKALVVVGPEERLETVGLRPFGYGDVVAIAEPLLGFDHEGEAHPGPPSAGRHPGL